MKRNDCSIVQDLLPLYIEDMLQPDTVEYVEDHLSGCEGCTALLAELKNDGVPTPDAEDARTGDQRVLKGLKKTLTTRNLTLCFATFLYVTLLYSPLMGYNGIPWRVETISLLLSAVLLFVMFYVSRQTTLSRNTARFLICISVFSGCAPLYFLVSFFCRSIYSILFVPGVYRPDSVLDWLSMFMPAYGMSVFVIPASALGILLTVIVLRRIRRKTLPHN